MSTEKYVMHEGLWYVERPDDPLVHEYTPEGVVETRRDGSQRLIPYRRDPDGVHSYIDTPEWYPHQIPLKEGSA